MGRKFTYIVVAAISLGTATLLAFTVTSSMDAAPVHVTLEAPESLLEPIEPLEPQKIKPQKKVTRKRRARPPKKHAKPRSPVVSKKNADGSGQLVKDDLSDDGVTREQFKRYRRMQKRSKDAMQKQQQVLDGLRELRKQYGK